MFRRFLSSILALTLLAASPSAYAISAQEGIYYFRYKAESTNKAPVTSHTKDIVAFYIGGVSKAFSEKLPMKTQWENDDWRVTKGNLPSGIFFDNHTFTFSGTPQVVTKQVVELTGYDAEGKEVASAEVHFDIYDLPDSVVNVDFYAHTGKFSTNALQLPNNVTIHRDPELLTAAPAGITYNARYFEGIPTAPGRHPVLAMGYDYLGKAIIAFTGYYTVTDGPEFASVADDIRPLSQNTYYGCGTGTECAVWDKTAATRIERAIKDAGKVRYYVETENNSGLPNGLTISNDVYNRTFSGRAFNYYDQIKIRYKAIDTDGTVGYSNWFKIGTGGPIGVCQPADAAAIILSGTVGNSFLTNGYAIPSGQDSADKLYTIVSGTLPVGLNLNPQTGLISGTPTAKSTNNGIQVQVSFPNSPENAPFTCGPYNISINAASFALTVTGYQADYRVGDDVTATVEASGALIGDANIELDPSSTLPQGVVFDASTGKLAGKANGAGSFSAVFKLTNGDGAVKVKTASFTVHNELTINPFETMPTIRQYDLSDNLVSVSFDQENVIGTATVALMGGPLPEGLNFDGFSTISGGTRLPPIPSDYGPFSFRLSDSTGDYVDSNEFYIKVTERAGLVASDTANPLNFTVGWSDPGQKAFSVTQPVLAQNFLALQYELNGPALPEGLLLNPATGHIYGQPTEKSSTSGYSITIKENSPANLEKTSEIFAINVGDPPLPADVGLPALLGNVSGPRIVSTNPASAIATVDKYLIGGAENVTFISSEPTVPGLTFNASNGTISGEPTAEFSGDVTITYEDQKQRQGHVILPVTIYPHPAVATSSSFYSVPRLSDSSEITIYPTNSGFYRGVTWSLAPGSDNLPTNMNLVGNQITGRTTDASGTTKNIVIRGTSVANGLTADAAFTIKITDPAPLTFNIPKTFALRYALDLETGSIIQKDLLRPKDYVGGSFVAPLTFNLFNQPAWLSISADGILNGTPPMVGDYTAEIAVTDFEGRSANSSFKIHVTLNGDILIAPGPGGVKRVRVGESFKTSPQTVSHAVDPWTAVPNTPDGLSFDGSDLTYTGRFDQISEAATSVPVTWDLQIVDDHGRTLEGGGSEYEVNVINRLKIRTPADVEAKQHSATKPIFIAVPAAENQMGFVGYSLEGDIPGTLYYKGFDSRGSATYATYTHYLPDGSTEVVTQGDDETVTEAEARLAPDHIIFDSYGMTIRGIPSKSGTYPVRITAIDSHVYGYWQMSDPTREAYNQAQSNWFNIVVDSAEPFTVNSTVNPKGVVVPEGNANVTVFPINDAYGAGVTWQASNSTLPTGITYRIEDNVVKFSGYSTDIGTYSITLKATDALGRETSMVQTFKVFTSTDPIVLNVSNVKTKVGYPAQMVLPFATMPLSTSNTFGPVAFSSNTLPQIKGISLNQDTGFIDGRFTAPQQFTFDLYATDDTNRITSKPVSVEVIPNLRVIVPQQIDLNQGDVASQTIATDYRLGTVTYAKGTGTWPEGINVDPNTGKLIGKVIGLPGTYSGLTIVGTDKFGTFTDAQSSNTFSIVVGETTDQPDIADTPNNKLLFSKEGTFASFKPTVTEVIGKQPWQYTGTTYTANRDLSEFGLSIDSATGEISGTPSKPIIIPDLVITVTAANGSSDSTTPFWFGIEPKDPIVIAAGQKSYYPVRVGSSSATDPLTFLNAYGKLKFTNVQPLIEPIDPDTGVYSATLVTAASMNGQPVGGWPEDAVVTDEFGRTGTFRTYIEAFPALGISSPNTSVKIIAGSVYSNLNAPTVSGVVGTASYSATGLPLGLTLGTNGSLQGTASTDLVVGQTFAVTVQVTDSKDGASKSVTYQAMVVAPRPLHRYWRARWLPGGANSTDTVELQLISPDGVNQSLRVGAGTATVGYTAVSNPGHPQWGIPSKAYDGSDATYANFIADGTGYVWVSFDFGATPIGVESFRYALTGPAYPSWSGRQMTLQFSDNGTTWTNYLATSTPGYTSGETLNAP